MTDFDTLSQHEQALAMLLAYFGGFDENKSTILKIGAKLMVPELVSDAFRKLSSKGLLQKKKLYYSDKPTKYRLQRELIFPALFELFEPENYTLLKNIRSLFKNQHNIDKPDYTVREMLALIAPTGQPESLNVHVDASAPLLNDISGLMDKPKYKRIFDRIPDAAFALQLKQAAKC